MYHGIGTQPMPTVRKAEDYFISALYEPVPNLELKQAQILELRVVSSFLHRSFGSCRIVKKEGLSLIYPTFLRA